MFSKVTLKAMISLIFVKGLRIDEFFRKKLAKKLIILTYHRVTTSPTQIHARQRGMYVAKKQFAQQLDYLSKHFTIVSVSDVTQYLNKQKPLPDFPVLITFDDGYRDNYLHAFPLLQKKKSPATMFATTGFIDRKFIPWTERYYHIFHYKNIPGALQDIKPNSTFPPLPEVLTKENLYSYLKGILPGQRDELLQQIETKNNIKEADYDDLICSWDELKEMAENGIAIEAHTISHPKLPDLDDESIEHEIVTSQRRIEKKLNRKVSILAYPSGEFNLRVIKQTAMTSISMAFTTRYGTNDLSQLQENRYVIKRCGIGLDDTLDIFKMKVTGAWSFFAK